MQNISVDNVHLRNRVLVGKKKHLAEYAKAHKKYRAAVHKQAVAMAKHAVSKAPTPERGDYISVHPPINRVDDFNRIIEQLDASTDVKITLREDEFDRLWRGQWEFANELRVASMEYGKVARRATKF